MDEKGENAWEKAVDIATVQKVQAQLPEDAVLQDVAELLRVFGDPNRVKILYALSVSEMCVSDICIVTGMKQSAVSHQLRLLKTAHLVRYRREGRGMFYSLDDDHVERILEQGFAHTGHIERNCEEK